MRRDKPSEELVKTRGLDGLDPQEFPLYRAAQATSLPFYREPQTQDLKTGNKLVQVLLAHGANPFAKFSRRIADDNGVSDTDTKDPEGYEECTVVHELLCEKGL
ncbi:hypothetical protein PHISCL_10992, partial [Aspergillus sclerotialis]